jgi:hypothetical protein
MTTYCIDSTLAVLVYYRSQKGSDAISAFGPSGSWEPGAAYKKVSKRIVKCLGHRSKIGLHFESSNFNPDGEYHVADQADINVSKLNLANS